MKVKSIIKIDELEKKLETMTVRIGYPDNWPQDRYELMLAAPEEGGIYVDNICIHKMYVYSYVYNLSLENFSYLFTI